MSEKTRMYIKCCLEKNKRIIYHDLLFLLFSALLEGYFIRQFIFKNHSIVYIVLIMLDAFLAFNIAKELSEFEKESEILKNILEQGEQSTQIPFYADANKKQ